MEDLYFWKRWGKPFKILYFSLLSLFLLLLFAYFYHYYLGVDNLLPWQTAHQINNLKYFITNFDVGIFNIQTPAFSYIIEENFKPADLKIHVTLANVFVIIIFLCLAIINTIITNVNRIYFLAGIGTLILGFLLFKFHLLGVFGLYNKTLLFVVIVLVAALSYYFHAFRPDIGFFKRFMVFLLVYTALLAIIFFFSAEKLPLFILANEVILFTSLISLLFIISISHEILFAFLFLVSYSASSRKNTVIHFITVALLYLLCLILLYLRTINVLNLNIFGTDAFVILSFSILVGIYGLKFRESSYKNILSFDPLGGLLYLSIAIICLSSFCYLFNNNNDPAIEAFQDFIIFSHIGIGFMFLLYVLVNFYSLLIRNLPVYKVAFQPKLLPFNITRLGGVLLASFFLFKANFAQFSQGIAGYLNGIGDVSYMQENTLLATQYYKLGREYDLFNHKSNYSLAAMSLIDSKKDDAIYYLKESFKRSPSPQGFIKLSNLYLNNDLYFDAIYALKEGIRLFPENGYLYNNLALLYNRTALIDSAYTFIQLSKKNTGNHSATQTNFFGFLARNFQLLHRGPDSLLNDESITDYLPLLNNQVALYNIAHKEFKEVLPLRFSNDSTDADEKFSLLNNIALNRIKRLDSSLLNKINNARLQTKDNTLSENMGLVQAIVAYYNKDVKKAFGVLSILKETSVSNIGYYNLLCGLWSLENKAPEMAVEYLNAAMGKGMKEAFYYKAIALSEEGNFEDAQSAWESVIQLKNPVLTPVAESMVNILKEQNIAKFNELSDEDKYQVLRYRKDLTREQRNDLLQSISDPDLKLLSRYNDAEERWFKLNVDSVSFLSNNLINQNSKNRRLLEDIKVLYFKTLVKSGQYEKLKSLLAKAEKNSYYNYFLASIKSEEKKPKDADSLYSLAIKALPFDSNVLEGALNFYNKRNGKEDEAYNLALDAVHLNPHSERFLELYIIQAIKNNLINYAAEGLGKLKEIANPNEFERFQKIFDQERINAENNSWK